MVCRISHVRKSLGYHGWYELGEHMKKDPNIAYAKEAVELYTPESKDFAELT